MYNDVISQLTITIATNDIGDMVETIVKSERFAKVKSVGMKENYEALAVGLKPELVFVLSDYYDYDDQEFIEYETKRYKVIRKDRKKTNELEIVCEGLINPTAMTIHEVLLELNNLQILDNADNPVEVVI